MFRPGTPARLLLVGVLPGLLCGCMAMPSHARSTDAAQRFGPSATPGTRRSPSALPLVTITAPAAPSAGRPAPVQRPDAPDDPPVAPVRPQSPRQPAAHRARQNRAPVRARPPVDIAAGLCEQAEWSGQLPSGLGASCRQMLGR
ncbi:hypothetical protein ACFOSC_08175 [Streptantibioticus rubrisoli]|uniref:Lipoprotein n=1 Tax=Streptantibioticus rubrisoli TaxID=1387313 RepID=A0ABT1P7I6_9ACTN|nr:hypothetical protein [Streptantibioticus rubrisoli]MCQ4041336.1 hypothetical protein [Streptantibioticus rubrisoli]